MSEQLTIENYMNSEDKTALNEFAESLGIDVDLRKSAENIILEIQSNLKENEEVIVPEVVEEIQSLTFASSGWCRELKKSYRKGTYLPLSIAEYEALKKYAK